MKRELVNSNITIENAQIKWRNFTGLQGKFNAEGSRNFCVILEDQMAETLRNDGWNVRKTKPTDPDEEPKQYLQVSVGFKIPPKIVLITKKNKRELSEADVYLLDWAEIENVDVIIRPYNWEAKGQTGVKAYLKSIYVTIVEDEFEEKYRDVPDSAVSIMAGNAED